MKGNQCKGVVRQDNMFGFIKYLEKYDPSEALNSEIT
jgi:hypothetical protein